MTLESLVLTGHYVRLEPLSLGHLEGLVAASAGNPELYRWSAVPQSREAILSYIETALALSEAGHALVFATIRIADQVIIGSTRYFDMENWAWPQGHERHGWPHPDVCEIGYTWLTQSAIRTAANTEAKFLMLTQAFDVWQMLRVCLHTDARNKRSQAAIERIGGKFEGVLRAHRLAVDNTPRNSFRYSILAAEWPEVKRRLSEQLQRA